MTLIANQGSDVQPNVLRSQTIPNTLGELGQATATARPRFRPRAMVALAAVVLAALALALSLARIT
jgi:hypothetical protein